MIAAVLLGSCSGDEDERARAQFVRQAERACRIVNLRATRLKGATDNKELVRYLDRLVPLLEDLAGRQARLRPPEGLEQDWRRFRELDERSREATVAFREAARSGDAEALRRAGERAEELDTRYDAAADRLGLQACAEDPMPER